MTVGTYDIWRCDCCGYETRVRTDARFAPALPKDWTHLAGSRGQRSGHLCGECSRVVRDAIGIPAEKAAS
jgi:hypothetical protein